MREPALMLTACVAMFASTIEHPMADDNIVVRASGGGVFAEALKRICDDPFTKETGIAVQPMSMQDSTAQIRAQMVSGNVTMDISDASADAIFEASKNGWLEPLDWNRIDPDKRLPDIARHPNGIAFNSFSQVLVARKDKQPEGKTMSSWTDFWNVKAFPGPRSLEDIPVNNLEYALMADGVAPSDVYKILRSPGGIDRAFKKLDEIRPHITIWWTSAQQPLQLLASGEVYYASAYNGRVKPLQRENVPVGIVWNGGSFMVGYHSILKGAKHRDNAYKWLKFCWTDPVRGAEMTKVLPYPGFVPGSLELLPADMQKDLPTYPANLQAQMKFDGEFWNDNRAAIQRGWAQWRLQ